MKKKLVLPGLIVGLVLVLLVGRVFGAVSSDRTRELLNNSQYVWVGNETQIGGELKPVSLTGKLSKVLTQQEFALSFASEQVVKTLLQTKRASTSQAKQYYSQGLNLGPAIRVMDGNRVLVKTGGAGVAEFEAEKGRYALQVAPVDGVNLIVHSSVNINLDEYVVPIGINSGGSGTVKRIAGSSGVIKEASAQESAGNSKVKVALFYDKNSNGNWDSDEEVMPWAGVRVDLVNLGKKSGMEFGDQWKDIYLDNAKNGMKASDLVNDLSANCPTAGVSMTEGGVRKTFLKREGEVFGEGDFEITPGRVYSIKGCDVPFYIIGYDLEKQFNQ